MTIMTRRLTIPSRYKGYIFRRIFLGNCLLLKIGEPLRKASGGTEKDPNSERKCMHLNPLTTSYNMNPIQFHF